MLILILLALYRKTCIKVDHLYLTGASIKENGDTSFFKAGICATVYIYNSFAIVALTCDVSYGVVNQR